MQPRLKSVGTDVEIFAFDPKTKQHKSLCGLIGGTKDKPLQQKAMLQGFALQEDNVSVEYNIPPVISKAKWIVYNQEILTRVKTILKEHKWIMSQDSSALFADEELQHPNALVFGCEPDYDAWKRIENPKPICDNPNLRTAGGHIHVGTNVDMITGIQQMDLYLGIPSLILDDNPASQERRKLYGKAGAMRPKPYGFEYRVLSNFWCFNEELLSWVYSSTENAILNPKEISAKMSLKIQNAINTGDKNAANDITGYYGITLPTILPRGKQKNYLIHIPE